MRPGIKTCISLAFLLELEEDFQFNDSQIHYLFIHFKGEFKHRDLTSVLSSDFNLFRTAVMDPFYTVIHVLNYYVLTFKSII